METPGFVAENGQSPGRRVQADQEEDLQCSRHSAMGTGGDSPTGAEAAQPGGPRAPPMHAAGGQRQMQEGDSTSTCEQVAGLPEPQITRPSRENQRG